MDEEAVLRKRVTSWKRLSELSDKADGGLRRMSGIEVVEFVRLYRRASADLALMSTQTSNVEVVAYLNGLVTRAYGILYRAPSRPFAVVVQDSVRSSAQTFRRNAWAFFVSLAIFMAAAGFSFGMMRARPDLREHFVSEDMEPVFTQWKSGQHEQRRGGENIGMTAFYASNNPRAGIMMNAVSIATFGTLTTYILWVNGSMVGALAADMASVGKLGFLLSSIAPHGVSEIGGFLTTAAGGFVMAWALVCPGRQSRGQALRKAGKDAFVLLMTGLVMIAIAAPIEGFFSFNPSVPQIAKTLFAIAAFAGWTAFFVGYAKDGTEIELVSRSSQRSAS